MLDVEGFILVGGASSRMGTDKSRLVLNGETTTALITRALQRVTGKVSVVGSSVDTSHASLRIVPDLHERWGPLGGIHAALHACEAEFCLVAACDLPFLTSDLFDRLLHLTIDANTTFDAVVPVQADGRPQPLCAVYRTAPCLIAADQSIALGEHTPRSMLDRIRARYLNFNEFADLPNSENFFFNLNRPEDYERAKEVARRLTESLSGGEEPLK